jgi:hypothetical protein
MNDGNIQLHNTLPFDLLDCCQNPNHSQSCSRTKNENNQRSPAVYAARTVSVALLARKEIDLHRRSFYRIKQSDVVCLLDL